MKEQKIFIVSVLCCLEKGVELTYNVIFFVVLILHDIDHVKTRQDSGLKVDILSEDERKRVMSLETVDLLSGNVTERGLPRQES